MDITPLAQSGLAIQLHAGSATIGLLLGTLIVLLEKGTGAHRLMGRVWVAAMLVVALSSFWITEARFIGPFGPIHILSVATLVGLFGGVRAIRRGDLRTHRINMFVVYGSGMLLAGGFTLLPGRRMHAVLFGDGGGTALVAALCALALIAAILAWRFRRILWRARAME